MDSLFLLLPLTSLRQLRRDRGLQMLCASVMLFGNADSGIIQHVRYLIPLAPIVALLVASLIRYKWLVALVLAAWILTGLYSARDFRSIIMS